MKINYRKKVARQENNPFCVFEKDDHHFVLRQLTERLAWINQLGVSKDPHDQEVFDTLTNTKDRTLFGVSPHYGNVPNTAVASLGGAVEKMFKGDLSQKQMERAETVCRVLNQQYPDRWGKLEFEELKPTPREETFNRMFSVGQ